MNLLIIFFGALLTIYSAFGLAWSLKGGKKPNDEVIVRRGAPLKVRAFQIRVAIVLIVGLLVLLAGIVAPPWP